MGPASGGSAPAAPPDAAGDAVPVEERPGVVAVVLAAGKGTRMRSALPKVLHRAAGRPLLAWVLDAAHAAGCSRLVVVIGHGAAEVRADPAIAAIERRQQEAGGALTWVLQAEQRGTGDALLRTEPEIAGAARLLVLSGDVPLVGAATLRRLLDAAEAGWGAMAVAEMARPGSLGRVIAAGGAASAPSGHLVRIVEAADATPSELALDLVNAGLYVLPSPEIFSYLRRLEPANAQNELYLTDAVGAAAAAGHRVALVRLDEAREALGVNDRRELAAVHRLLIDRHLDALMRAGVSVLEPARTSVEATVGVGADTVLHPGVSLFGRTEVGAGCTLHQGAWVRDSRLGDGVTVGPYCVLDGAAVESGAEVGPFVRLAPASRLQSGAPAGTPESAAGGAVRQPDGTAADGARGD
jgi:bifunctional UDP-N-acetylglucosamine pyrophosphorylase/glucosamine-1-phosphate N-acetyltransferase